MPPNSPLTALAPNLQPSVDQGEGAGLRSVGEEGLRPSGEGKERAFGPRVRGRAKAYDPLGKGLAFGLREKRG